jgi:hypothetical protein
MGHGIETLDRARRFQFSNATPDLPQPWLGRVHIDLMVGPERDASAGRPVSLAGTRANS